MRSVLAYTIARLALFAATFGVLYLLLGALNVLDFKKEGAYLVLLALSVLISGVVSYVLLARQRDRVSAAMAEGMRERRHRFDEARTKEDS